MWYTRGGNTGFWSVYVLHGQYNDRSPRWLFMPGRLAEEGGVSWLVFWSFFGQLLDPTGLIFSLQSSYTHTHTHTHARWKLGGPEWWVAGWRWMLHRGYDFQGHVSGDCTRHGCETRGGWDDVGLT